MTPAHEDPLRDLGASIRRQREANAMTQAELAMRASIDRSYLSGIESGKRSLTVLVLLRIAHGLDTSAAELLPGGPGSL